MRAYTICTPRRSMPRVAIVRQNQGCWGGAGWLKLLVPKFRKKEIFFISRASSTGSSQLNGLEDTSDGSDL